MHMAREGEGTKHKHITPNILNSYITSQKKREAAVAKPTTAASAPAAGTVVVAKDVDTGVSAAAVGDGGLPVLGAVGEGVVPGSAGEVGEGVVPGSAGEVGDEVQLSKSQAAPLR